MPDIFYRRNLPHYHLDHYPLFITFRLAGSIPANVLDHLKAQRELDLKASKEESSVERHNIEQRYFEYYDGWLDRCEVGPHWLLTASIAQIVMKEIHNLSGSWYTLMACCIMPNHVHLLIESHIRNQGPHAGKTAKYPVTDAVRLLKGRTAPTCTLELRRTGNFWQHESYDHIIHPDKELTQTIE